jgi:uncharacterized protein YjiS (DUF1127 family)
MHTLLQHTYATAILVWPPFRLWLRRITTRGDLRDLDARQLADIGCSERERWRECAKWFWQA